MNKHVVIAGGGISGLTTAFYLSRLPRLKITLLEASERFGGVVRTSREGPCAVEAAVDTFDGRGSQIRKFLALLGLTSDVIKCEPSLARFFLRKDRKTEQVKFSPKILRGKLLSFHGKVKLLLSIFSRFGDKNPGQTIRDFFCCRFGEDFYKQIGEPVVRGVIMEDPGELDAAEYFSGSPGISGPGDKSSAFSFHGGMERLIGSLEERLGNVDLRCCERVSSVTSGDGWTLHLGNGKSLSANVVCLALPAHESGKVLLGPVPAVAESLLSIDYDAIAVLNMVFRLSRFPEEFKKPGFIVSGAGEKWPFACLKICGYDETEKLIRLKVFFSERFQKDLINSPDDIVRKILSKAVTNEWDLEEPVWTSLERYPSGLPKYRPGHGRLVRGILDECGKYRGLFLTGNWSGGFGIADCIREAERTACAVRSYLQTSLVPSDN